MELDERSAAVEGIHSAMPAQRRSERSISPTAFRGGAPAVITKEDFDR
jgi:hypothetical protein